MQIVKLSQFKKETNHIVNYFVLDYGNKKPISVEVFPFFITSETFRKQLNQKNKTKNIPDFTGKIIHACYDMSSNRIYFPEVTSTEELTAIQNSPVFYALEIEILQKHKAYASSLKIAGNPYQIFRIRKVKNFFSASAFIKKNIVSSKNPFNEDLLVIEADLNSMPKTANFLNMNKYSESCFVNKDKIVPFIRNVGTKDYLLYTLQGPFILIDSSLYANMSESESEKNRMVVENYKKYFEEQISTSKTESMDKTRIFNTKYLLLLGHSVKQMCQDIINPANTTASDLLVETSDTNAAKTILEACKEIKDKGYKNPLNNYYYYIFKRSNIFPKRLLISETNTFNTSAQNTPFQVLYYDPQEDLLTLRSQLYISEDVCKKIFLTNDIAIFSYFPDDKKIMSVKDIKTANIKNSAKSIINNIRQDTGFGEKETLSFEKITTAPKFLFTKRKVSDFYEATDVIKEICKRAEKISGKEVKFEDLDVYLGPFKRESQMAGVVAGYIDPNRCREKNMEIPIRDLVPGLELYPRNIIIDTEEKKSAADIYDAIIHEYTHDINMRTGVKSPQYEMPGSDMKKFLSYLDSPDEREAHIQQIMLLLSFGMSNDLIIKRMLKKFPDFNNLPAAEKYSEFIEEAEKRLEEIDKNKEEEKTPIVKENVGQKEDKKEEEK